ncbi:acyl-CoA N-acyltransferase [Paramyrothecium foliicola]|nr:acyl-CoA N-acyltransferase [Paramyrothecium foliicola]
MGSSSELGKPDFVLFTPQLILVPTPIAVFSPSYRSLYANLHRNVSFCQMAFGDHFPAVEWSDEDTQQVIETRDIARSWAVRGLGDFAVGLRQAAHAAPWGQGAKELQIPSQGGNICMVEGLNFHSLMDGDQQKWQAIEWVGYAGVRDATTTSMRRRAADELPLPPWEEMVEIRYGVAPDYWGRGIARSAGEAVMQWAVAERGVTRFIAETERANARSGSVLKKMGFSLSGTEYWEEPSEVEWERIVQS